MKNKYSTSLLLLALLFFVAGIAAAQQAQYPIVKGFGGIYEIPGTEKLDPDMKYNIVIDLKYPQSNEQKINKGLQNVARMINLHGLGGAKAVNINVVVAVHGEATSSILSNAGYQRKYGADNPNIPLIDALTKAGAELYVCGQSLLARGYDRDEIYSAVTVELSMLTIVTTYMNRGYKKLVF